MRRLHKRIVPKNVSKSNFPQLKKALPNCIREYEAKSSGLIITGVIFKAKATDFAEKLGISNFKVSSGFISMLKNRDLLYYSLFSGESATEDKELYADWMKQLTCMLENYEPRNIFNWNETVLFWRLLDCLRISL